MSTFFYDEESLDCVIIDPTFLPRVQLDFIKQRGWTLRQIWLTHGHFDHAAGTKGVSEAFDPPVPIAMGLESLNGAKAHPSSAIYGGVKVDEIPRVDIPLSHGMWLGLRTDAEKKVVEVRDVSGGHNPGSMMFIVPSCRLRWSVMLYQGSIGRTDFPGSEHALA